jgi:hypothetical protein
MAEVNQTSGEALGKESHGRHELGTLVVNIELTLASIIQGVALYFLTDNAREALGHLLFERWIYVVNGLLVIFLFWCRAVEHTLTLLRWPLHFSHNFLYIACALVEAVTFTELGDPLRWFAFHSLFAFLVWITFVADLQLIERRAREANGQAAKKLYRLIRQDQYLNIFGLVPALFLFSLAATFFIARQPEFTLEEKGHLWFGFAQFASLIAYLIYSLRLSTRFAPLIDQALAERLNAHGSERVDSRPVA